MNETFVTEVRPDDAAAMAMVDRLLESEGLRRDACLDYTCAAYDADGSIIATGSCFGSTLRCFAVSPAHQGEGLLNRILTHLTAFEADRGNYRLFLYTKPDAASFFGDLGFHEIARVPGSLVFMENRRSGFSGYLNGLAQKRREGTAAAVVMNANPFTLGHLYLAEQAAAACDTLHLFIVSEDLSEFSFADRRKMVELGTAHIPNAVLHDCGQYLISAATFPSYFLKEASQAAWVQARLDAEVFTAIAKALGISARWVGEEPGSEVTALYNSVMAQALPAAGIRCVVLPRMEVCGRPVSAGEVRSLLRLGDLEALRSIVPETTFAYLTRKGLFPDGEH